MNGSVQFPQALPTNDQFKGNPQQRMKIKMRMESKVGDLVDKIRKYTVVDDDRQIYLFRVICRGFRSANRLNYISEDGYDKEDLFRRDKNTEVFFVRLRSHLDEVREVENAEGADAGPDSEQIA